MLVLSRHPGEEIVCVVNGVEIVFTIVDARLHKVRVGVTAPPEVAVHRREVYDRITAKDEDIHGHANRNGDAQ